MYKLTNLFKVLSDETRLRLLVLLYHKKLCVCEMCGITGESQPKISKHLAKLRDIGLVKVQRQEQFIFYNLNTEEEIYKDVLKQIVDHLDDYPLLKKDVENCRDTKEYIELCSKV